MQEEQAKCINHNCPKQRGRYIDKVQYRKYACAGFKTYEFDLEKLQKKMNLFFLCILHRQTKEKQFTRVPKINTSLLETHARAWAAMATGEQTENKYGYLALSFFLSLTLSFALSTHHLTSFLHSRNGNATEQKAKGKTYVYGKIKIKNGEAPSGQNVPLIRGKRNSKNNFRGARIRYNCNLCVIPAGSIYFPGSSFFFLDYSHKIHEYTHTHTLSQFSIHLHWPISNKL